MKLTFLLITFSLAAFSQNKCGQEGEEWHPFLPGSGYKTCCSGLVGTSQWQFSQKTKQCVPNPPGDRGFCVKCGDNKCDQLHYENHCNCPKDCK